MAIKIGYQTLTWDTSGGDEHVPGALDDIKEAGFRGVEICEPLRMLGSVDEFQVMLDERGLQLISLSCGVSGDPGNREEIDEVKRRIDYASQFGVYVLMLCGGFGPKREGDERRRAIQSLATVSEEIAGYAGMVGMDVAFHNHIGCAVETRADMDEFLDLAPTTKICLDTAHVAAVGGDCLKTIGDYGRRIVYAHLKDFDTTITSAGAEDFWRGFVELGEGNVGLDFGAIVTALGKQSMAEWAVIELDHTRTTPLESARKSFEYLRSLGIPVA